MKNSFLFYILFCITSLLMISACENAEMQKTMNNISDMDPIVFRGDCQLCPDNDECCCAIWMQPFETSADVFICGTSDGLLSCAGDPPGELCNDFNNGGHSFPLLVNQNDKEPFCMIQGNSFWIANTHPTDIAKIILTCQDDITNPDTIWLQIPPATRIYYYVNDACEIVPCVD